VDRAWNSAPPCSQAMLMGGSHIVRQNDEHGWPGVIIGAETYVNLGHSGAENSRKTGEGKRGRLVLIHGQAR
jgi:hypothetical protein